MAVPYAAAPVYPTAGASLHNATAQTFVAQHSDPDGDDIQAGEMQLRQGGTTTWTTYTASFLDLGNQRATFTVASGTMVPAGQWETRFRTSDGTYGPWSSIVFFSAFAQPAAPVITSGATVSSSPSTITWTAADQEAYQVRRRADNAGSPGATLWTGAEVESTSRQASVAFPVSPSSEHVEVRIRHQGVWSDWASQAVTVDYTYPEAPTVSLQASDPPGVRIAVTNPATGPAVVSNIIRRQQSFDGTVWTDRRGTRYASDLIRTVGNNGLWTDYRSPHLLMVRYQVQSVSDAGQSRNTGQTSYDDLDAQYATYDAMNADFAIYDDMEGSWTQ